MREKTVESYLRGKVRENGGRVYKFVSPGHKGVPDRIIVWKKHGVYPARIHFIEAKAPGKSLRPDQAREHARLKRDGAVVLVIDTKAKVDKYIAQQRRK